jgi:hypothetical protein
LALLALLTEAQEEILHFYPLHLMVVEAAGQLTQLEMLAVLVVAVEAVVR